MLGEGRREAPRRQRQRTARLDPGEPGKMGLEQRRILHLGRRYQAQEPLLVAGHPGPAGVAEAEAPAGRRSQQAQEDAQDRERLLAILTEDLRELMGDQGTAAAPRHQSPQRPYEQMLAIGQ